MTSQTNYEILFADDAQITLKLHTMTPSPSQTMTRPHRDITTSYMIHHPLFDPHPSIHPYPILPITSHRKPKIGSSLPPLLLVTTEILIAGMGPISSIYLLYTRHISKVRKGTLVHIGVRPDETERNEKHSRYF